VAFQEEVPVRHRHEPIVRAFLLGAVLGIGSALLLAPLPGRETRLILRHKVDELTPEARKARRWLAREGHAALDGAANFVDELRR
jgi:gas vesicle protein